MEHTTSAAMVRRLDDLIEKVEAHISEQCAQMATSEDHERDEDTLADMLRTLEQLHAFRERFYATVH